MKNNQKLSTLFWLFKAKATKKDGKAPLYARVTIDGITEEISMKIKINPLKWDSEKKKDTSPDVDAKRNNKKIQQAEVDLDRYFTFLQANFEVVTPIMLKNIYYGKDPMEHEKKPSIGSSQTILQVFNDYIKTFSLKVGKKQRSDGTLRHWRTTKRKLAAFIQHEYNKEDLALTGIRYSFAESFFEYLTLKSDEPISEATAKTHIKKTKQILTQCVKKELLKTNPISDYNCYAEEKEVIPLELSQVQMIFQKTMPVKRLEEVRDAFIFQCFTGFAYQDLYALSKENIESIGSKGEKWLVKRRGKTNVNEMVPILPIVEKIIKKYENDPYCVQYNCLLPVNSNYRYNTYLKELADICGINRDLHTHLARHTFADLMLNNHMPLEDVSKMLGHKTIRTTQRYARVRKSRIMDNMNILKNELFDSKGELKNVC